MKKREISVALEGQQPRGHVADLIDHPPPGVCYSSKDTPTDVRFGKASLHNRSKLSVIGRSTIVNKLGLFLPVIKFYSSSIDLVLALNRFYIGNRPSISWLERPAAPLHYEPSKLDNILVRKFVRRLIKQPKRNVVCWSNACAKEFAELYRIENIGDIVVVPPMVVPPVEYLKETRVIERQNEDVIKFLFVGSLFHIKGGKETLIAFEQLQKNYSSVRLTIVSEPDSVGSKWMSRIEGNQSVKFMHSTFSRDEMWKVYDTHQVLIHPTKYDSYGLVVLEAMRMGLPVVTCGIYCIPEIIIDGCGIILTHPEVSDGMIGYRIPIEKAEGQPLNILVNNLVEVMESFLNKGNRISMAKNAFRRGETHFGEVNLNNKWLNIFLELLRVIN